MRKIEEKYHDVLAVVGVHSAKFPAERAEAGLRDAVRRHGIHHPVVNDAKFEIWSQYAVRAWPTLFFIDPRGKIIGKHEGELPYESFDALLSQMVEAYDSEGLMDRSALTFKPEAAPEGALAYASKLLADAELATLFVADTGHNRVVELSLDGEVRRIWGGTEPGLADGDATGARFNHPQGLALRAHELYVADTENHAVRLLHLDSGRVETVAGTGRQARSYASGVMRARTAELSSPWDLEIVNDVLYIAMAGLHQIWALDLASSTVRPFAGTGREGIEDGPASQAWLAQTSGVTTDGRLLYFADSETSAVRVADPASGSVRTLVGLGLFEFGDVDGTGGQARLQHPLAVCHHKGEVIVADTYNHKIKRLNPATRSIRSWLGSGEAGHTDGLGREARFHEPGGLTVVNDTLYVADTNNHTVRVVQIETGDVTTLELRGL
ncbi:MAG: alkyl hydroperoxide reductase [Chloroflexota bacterium]|nr:alkyl hydroperoxide reductase [Chloroflexota bacterium]